MTHTDVNRVSHLKYFTPLTEHYGKWLNGFDWRVLGTGTFRRTPRDEHEAVLSLRRFASSLTRAMKFRRRELAYFAVLETAKLSGLGGVRPHWHFLMSCPDHPLVLPVAKQLWFLSHGFGHFKPFVRNGGAAHYVSKLLADGASYRVANLSTVRYSGPTDLIAAAVGNPRVPDRLKYKTCGRFLVTQQERSPESCSSPMQERENEVLCR
jgi:hypothetical protein